MTWPLDLTIFDHRIISKIFVWNFDTWWNLQELLQKKHLTVTPLPACLYHIYRLLSHCMKYLNHPTETLVNILPRCVLVRLLFGHQVVNPYRVNSHTGILFTVLFVVIYQSPTHNFSQAYFQTKVGWNLIYQYVPTSRWQDPNHSHIPISATKTRSHTGKYHIHIALRHPQVQSYTQK